ncbi:hypothetical protein CHH80_10830 [Bacillus sp. 7504-2]|nr:hypothetical protein CHH80_10830 [Bacillus sp. 7504-2]
MEDGDSEANVAHYCLHKLKKWPSEYLSLPKEEKAFVIASVQVKIDAEKKQQKEMERKSKSGRRGRRKR